MKGGSTYRIIVLGLLGFFIAVPTHAGEYPTKPITLVAPYGPGGAADLAARSLASVLPQYIGQPVLVINKTGASGATGSAFVANSKPDGYTFLLARVGSQAVTPALKTNLPYKWNDFTFIGLLELNPYVCNVQENSPYKTFSDLVNAIKSNPGKLNYSVSGVGTIHNMGPQMLFSILGLDKTAGMMIPYKGGGAAATALLGGHVNFGCSNLASTSGHIRGGKLRALVVTTPKRFAAIPDVPTARELGYPDLERIIGWSALYGPKGLDKSIVGKWAKVLQKVSKNKAWLKFTKSLGSVPQIRSPEATAKWAEEQFSNYRALGKKLGLLIK